MLAPRLHKILSARYRCRWLKKPNIDASGINIFIADDPPRTGARIKVIGIGGGGSNAVNRMIEAGIEGIEFLVANTDLQALKRSRAPIKIQLGSRLTKGLGAGADPGVGREAALEDKIGRASWRKE